MDTPPLHETAGSHLVKQIPTASLTDTVSYVLSVLPGRVYDSTDAIYIVDGLGRLLGLVPLSQVLAANVAWKMSELMIPNLPMVDPDEDQEQVALLAMKYSITSIPVVDLQKRLLGVVPPQALFEVLRREHIEDLNRLVGIWKENNRALSAIEASPTRRVSDRLPWLLLGLMCRISCSGYCRWVRNNHRVPLALATVLYGEGSGFWERTCRYDYSGCTESFDLFSYC